MHDKQTPYLDVGHAQQQLVPARLLLCILRIIITWQTTLHCLRASFQLVHSPALYHEIHVILCLLPVSMQQVFHVPRHLKRQQQTLNQRSIQKG